MNKDAEIADNMTNEKEKSESQNLNDDNLSPVDQVASKVKNEKSHSPVDQTTSKVQNEKSHSQVDQGWAWAVMFAAFANLLLIMTFLRSTSLLFILFLEKYQESATMTAMTLMFCTAMFALSNILGPAVLFHRFEVRTLTITGSIINFISIFIVAFAPNIYVVDAMMACLGFSHGLIAVPQMTLIGRYFKKRLSLATAFVSLGLSVATIGGPPLTQLLLDAYGLQGTIIILAGINMNCIPASMLFRAISCEKQPDGIAFQESVKQEDSVDVNDDDQTLRETSPVDKVYDQRDFKAEHEKVSLMRSISYEPPYIINHFGDRNNQYTFSQISRYDTTSDPDIDTAISKEKDNIVTSLLDKISLSNSVRYLSDINICVVESILGEDSHIINPASKIQVVSTDEPSRFQMDGESTNIYLTETSTDSPAHKDQTQTCFVKVRQWMSQSIYFHPLAILLLLASGFGVHAQAFIGYMPAAGKENGLTNDQVPFLLTILGVTDLLSKIGVGFFADLGYVRRINIVLIFEVFCAVLLQFVSFFKGFGLMIVLQIGLGVTMSTTHTFLTVIIVDILGVQHIGHIMSGYFLVNGLIMSLDHVIAGLLKDFKGSFLMSYNYFGGLIFFSALLLFLMSMITRCKSGKP